LGTIAAGRSRPELENLLGCFVNFLPLRIQLNGSETGRNVLMAVKAALLEAHRHVDCPFEKIVETLNPERRQDRNPIYNVGFLLQNFPRTILATGDLTGTYLPVERDGAVLDLRFVAEEDERGLSLSCDYRIDLFERQTISELMEAFARFLQQLVETPQMELAGFELPEALAQRSAEARTETEPEQMAITGTFALEPLEEPLQFWVKKLGLPIQLEFAPYNQVFQQLLDPASLLRTNKSGLNVILLRIEDWQRNTPGNDGLLVREKLTGHLTELVSALSAASAQHAAAHLVCLCPSSKAAVAHPANPGLLHELEGELVQALDKVNGVYLITAQELTRLYPVTEVYDPQEDELGHVPYTPVYFAALATLIIRKFHALKQPPRKVIALDCDDTLWTGICGEEAPATLKLEPGRAALQTFMRAQLESGMLLCLCSKNNPSDVDAVFAAREDFILRPEHFAARQINWRSKSENLRNLAAELSLGLDSFVFLDDSPVECAEVQASCPEVLALQIPQAVEQVEDFLKHCWAFDRLKVTSEDKQRTALYRQNRLREQLRAQSTGLAEFVARLELQVEIEALEPERLERVAQLTQRTNQFNVSTRRRTEAELRELQQRDGMEILTVSVRDRFGEYGLVGVLIFKAETGRLGVDSFLLSCRVLGRGVEHQMLAHLGAIAAARGLAQVEIHFEPTPKNKPAGEFLEKLGDAWRQPSNGGYSFRFPAEAASNVRFEAVREEKEAGEPADLHKPSAAVASANPWVRVGSHLQWIAVEANDAAKILAQIEASAGVGPASQADYLAPRTEVERQLCELWRKLLRVERIGVRDDFFQMGGHSLLAVRLMGKVEKLTEKKLPVVTIFQAPTVELLAAVISGPNSASPDDRGDDAAA
jgi:FkbH-like protein